MFALPGIVVLVVFLIGRPFDLIPALRGLPLLYLFCGVAIFGFLLDLRLGFARLPASRRLLLVGAFAGWCIVSVALNAPATLVKSVTSLAVLLCVYVLVGHGIRTFKAFEVLAMVLLGCSLWICIMSVQLGMQPKQCVAYWPGETRLEDLGHPDGRPCELTSNCRAGGDENSDYSCEHAGWFGMTSVETRVRYVGTLQDPNEVALFVAATLPFAFALQQRRRRRGWAILAAVTLILTILTVHFTKSRGGQLVLLTVLGSYAVQRWGLRRVVLAGAPVLLALLVAGMGEPRADAEASTLKRLGCLWAGLTMLGQNPIFGTGFNQFTQHHDQTAHNSYVLAAGELGAVGLLLWGGLLYLTAKPLVAAALTYRDEDSEVASIWAQALATSLIGLCVGAFFLSFTYHFVMWVYLALGAAFVQAVRTHDPDFEVPLNWRDFVVVAGGCTTMMLLVWAYTTYQL